MPYHRTREEMYENVAMGGAQSLVGVNVECYIFSPNCVTFVFDTSKNIGGMVN